MQKKRTNWPWLVAILTASISLASGCRTHGEGQVIPSLPSRFQILEVGKTNAVYIAPGPGVIYGVATDNLGLLYLQGLDQ